jgi:hypothetical protein
MTLAKTFCSAPWFRTRIGWNGLYQPCCELNKQATEFNGRTQYSLNDTTVDEWMSSEYSQYLRQQLSQGVKIAECDRCWKMEKNNLESPRQSMNNTATGNRGHDLDNTWVKLFVNRSQDYKDYRLLSADIKLSNICNFSCAMCNAHDSSKIFDLWHKDQNNQFVQERLTAQPKYFENIVTNYQSKRGYQHLQDILNHSIQHLKVLGGEPLLDKDLFRILQDQSPDKKSQIHVHMVTNGSQDIVQAVEKLQGYKSISFSVSLEGVGKIQDYVRAGSNWKVVEKNILEAKHKGILIYIHNTLQALTVMDFSVLSSWCHQHQLPLTISVLDTPDYLAISVLPDYLRKQIVDQIPDKNIIDLINEIPDCSDQYPKFLEYVSWYERDFTTKLRDIQPLFYTG